MTLRSFITFRSLIQLSALLAIGVLGNAAFAIDQTNSQTTGINPHDTSSTISAAAIATDSGDKSNATTATPIASLTAEQREQIRANLATLTAAQRKGAIKQGICPISGKPLGSMGLPLVVKANGQEVFLCCAACKVAFAKDPAKYIAKLKEEGRLVDSSDSKDADDAADGPSHGNSNAKR